jgi:hypothetical protein
MMLLSASQFAQSAAQALLGRTTVSPVHVLHCLAERKAESMPLSSSDKAAAYHPVD